MKNKKVIELAITGVFLLLTATIALASKEVEIKSITCPTTIIIGKFDDHGKFIGTESLTFEEYLKGVVPYELFPNFLSETLKAQTVAARNYAVRNMGRHLSEGYNLCNKKSPGGGRHCQAWEPPEDTGDGVPNGYPASTNAAVNNTMGIGVTYKGANIDTTYFSSSRNHYTKNSEDVWNYWAYLRKTITPESGSIGIGGHGIGMSQYGAQSLANSGVGYEDILKHYYGPVSPYVKQIKITQDGKLKYDVYWTDNNDYPNPTRKLTVATNTTLSRNSDVIIEVYFSERVFTGQSASAIKIKLANEEASYVPKSLSEGNDPPEKLKKRLTKDQLKAIGNGKQQILIEAKHEFIQDWGLDKKPATFCYQNHDAEHMVNYDRASRLTTSSEDYQNYNAKQLINYEEGVDENYTITIDKSTPATVTWQIKPGYRDTFMSAIDEASGLTSTNDIMQKLINKVQWHSDEPYLSGVIKGVWIKKGQQPPPGFNHDWKKVPSIINSWLITPHPMGQCMDFAGLLNAFAKGVGIPSRMLACIASPGWNFHCWNEVWINSVKSNDWSEADGTPLSGYLNGIGPVTKQHKHIQDEVSSATAVHTYDAKTEKRVDIKGKYQTSQPAPPMKVSRETSLLNINVATEKTEDYLFGDNVIIFIEAENTSDKEITKELAVNVKGYPPSSAMYFDMVQYPTSTVTIPPGSIGSWSYTLTKSQYQFNGHFRVDVSIDNVSNYWEFNVLSGLKTTLALPQSVDSNKPFDITLNIANLLPITINDTNVELSFPTYSNIENASFTIPAISPNSTYTRTWSVSVSEPGSNMAQAFVSSDNAGSDRADEQVTILGPSHIYCCFEPDNITAQKDSIFTLRGKVKNVGDAEAVGIKGTLTISGELATTESLLLNIGRILPHEEVEFTRKIAAVAQGSGEALLQITDANGNTSEGHIWVAVIASPHEISLQADRNIVSNQERQSDIILTVTNSGQEEDEIVLKIDDIWQSSRVDKDILYEIDDDGMPFFGTVKVPAMSEYRLNFTVYPDQGATGTLQIRAVSKTDPTAGSAVEIEVKNIPADDSYPSVPGKPSIDAIVNQGKFIISYVPANDADTGIVKYELQRKAGKEGLWITTHNDINGETSTVTVDPSLPSKGEAYYRLRAMNGTGMWGGYSPVSKKIMTVDWYDRVNTTTTTTATYEKASFYVPVGSFATSTTLAINKLSAPLIKAVTICSDSTWELMALDDENQEKQAVKPITITLGYDDADPDEETGELRYRIYRLNKEITPQTWEMVTGSQTVNPSSNTVSVQVSHLSAYGVFLPFQTQTETTSSALEDLNNVHVYPNPYKANKGDGWIYFKNLTRRCLIRIYIITGELVREIEVNSPEGIDKWDMKNEDGKDVASEVYIYLITNDKNQRTSGKMSVLR